MERTQSGNALFYVLIAVIMLGALTYAVTQTSRGGGSSLSNERASLYASEILDYAGSIASAYSQLRLRGCTAAEISFQNSVLTGHAQSAHNNPSAPASRKCHIFDPAGGGVAPRMPPEEALSETATAMEIITTELDIEGVGTNCTTNCAELSLVMLPIDEAACKKINDMVSVDNPSNLPPADAISYDNFGVFTGGNSWDRDVVTANTALQGKQAACIQDTDQLPAVVYVFYKVLAAR